MRNAFTEISQNITLWIACCSWFVAQLIKTIFDLKKTGRVNISTFIGSGGMPSSHTAFVTAMTTAIGYREGFNSSLFAVSAIISMVVMYDATGVRRAAGTHAAVINMIVESFQNNEIHLDKRLKELLGHTPKEVFAGAVLGILVACGTYLLIL